MRALFALVLIAGTFLFPAVSLGCTVIQSDIVVPREEVAAYFRERFKGAVFIGRVVATREVEVPRRGGRELMLAASLEVEKYWTGVDAPSMTVYTGTGGGACEADFKVGARYFLEPTESEGVLESTFLNTFEIDKSFKMKEKTSFFDEVFGPAKTFPKR